MLLFLKHWIDFSWKMTASMKLMIRMIDGNLILDKLRWRRIEIASEHKALSCSRMAENRSIVVTLYSLIGTPCNFFPSYSLFFNPASQSNLMTAQLEWLGVSVCSVCRLVKLCVNLVWCSQYARVRGCLCMCVCVVWLCVCVYMCTRAHVFTDKILCFINTFIIISVW